jgi:hypothetical protein
MAGKLRTTTAELLAIIAVAVPTRTAWVFLWPDGSYAPWVVLGIIVTLIALPAWAAWHRCYAAAILGTTLGVFGTAIRWSPNSQGLSPTNSVVLGLVAFVLAVLVTLAVLLIHLRAHIQEQIGRQ